VHNKGERTMEKIRVKLTRPWGEFSTGDKILCGAPKGRRLIENGIGIEIPARNKKGELLPNKIRKKKPGGDMIRIKLLKRWGGFLQGSVFDCGESKALGLIDSKIAERTTEKINQIKVNKDATPCKIKLLKDWGSFRIGEEINIGKSKAMPLISDGVAMAI